MAVARAVKDANVIATDPEAAAVEATAEQQQVDGNTCKLPPLPDTIPHRCTDVAWAVIFVLAVAGLTLPSQYALDNGNLVKFSHDFDYNRNLCGRDNCSAGKLCGPYLFFCKLPDGSPDFEHPICKHTCPKDNLTYSNCFDDTTGGVKLVADYETMKYGEKCLGARIGSDRTLVSSEFRDKKRAKSWTGRMIENVDSIRIAKWTFLFSATAVVLFSYAYLFMLKAVAAPALYVSMMLMIVLPVGLGLWGLWGVYIAGFNETMATNHGRHRLMFNLAFLAVGCVSGRVFCKMQKSFATAAGVLMASSECIFASPGIVLEPLALTVFKILIVCPFLALCAGLYSTGTIVLVDADPLPYRVIEYRFPQICYLVYAHFMLLWILLLVHSTSQYILCYIATRWYFIPVDEDGSKDQDQRGWLFCNAMHSAFRFHFGSIALASFLRTTLFIPWMLLSVQVFCPACCSTNKQGEHQDRNGVLFVFSSWLRKSVFMDMNSTSANFFRAAPRGLDVMDDQDSALAVLEATTLIFKMAGLGLNGVLCFAIGACATGMGEYTNADSHLFLANRQAVIIVHMVLGIVLSYSFVNTYEVVGDVIMYCVGLEERWWKDSHESSYTDNDGSWTQAGRKNCGAYTGLGWLMNDGNSQGRESPCRRQYAPDALLRAIQEASDSE